VPSYAVKVLYLGDSDDWGKSIDGLRPQLMGGCPVLIWDSAGLVGFVAKSVEGDMMNSNWLAQLMIAVSAHLLANEKKGSASEN